jgi:protein arginine kinase activator
MICQNCSKRTATVHVTDITEEGVKIEHHLCESCASEQGMVQKAAVPVTELLANFVQAAHGVRELADLTCPECGTTFVEFRNNGLLGCPHDYDAFSKPLAQLLERAHGGGSRHVGKVPHHAGERIRKQHEVARLRRDLDKAVKEENYELAAKLRDQIEAMGAS